MKKPLLTRLLLLIATASAIAYFPLTAQSRPVVNGLATWYGPGFDGARTASGEMFNPKALTAAHRSLPFGTQVKVTNVKNGQSVVVRINDRLGDPGVAIDLSSGAAQAIKLTQTSLVKMEIVER